MTRVLVDTHAVLWWLADDDALSATARATLGDAANEVLVSAASVWEIAIERSLGRLEAPAELPAILSEEGFAHLAVSPRHAWRAAELPHHHGDPFDRLLIAQALTEGIPVLTADAGFAPYGVGVMW